MVQECDATQVRAYTGTMTTPTQVSPDAGRSGRALVPKALLHSLRAAFKRGRRIRSHVTRDPEALIWLRRAVLRRKPVLYHFEVHLTDHCNLNCKGCTHFSNLCSPTFADITEFEADMERMASVFSRVRQIYLLGGEPLLHPKVGEFCKVARRHFPKSRIYLQTNATMVMRMDEQFWSDLAESRVILLGSAYPINLPRLEIDLLGKQRHVKVQWTEPYDEFYKIPIDPKGGHDAESSFRNCKGFNNRPILRDGRLYPCAYTAYSDVFRKEFGVGGLQVYPTDSISIREEHDPEEVFAFLRNPVHWCSNCDMDKRVCLTWGRSERQVSEWTDAPPPSSRTASTSSGASGPTFGRSS